MTSALGEIRNASGERLDHAFRAGEAAAPVVVIGHGVTANKDREWAVTLADALAAAGFGSLRFSFSGNGESDGDFRASCPTKEVADLGSVLDALGSRRAVYAGHSLGAAVGVMRASEDERIEALVSLAGMVDTAGFAERKFGHLEPGRDAMWEKPECPLSRAFLDDMRAVGTVEPLAERIRVPWLLVHGDADAVVSIEESEHIAARAPAGAGVVRIDGADHVFSGDSAAAMARAVVVWLRSLSGGAR